MVITRSEFENARKMIQEAIIRHGTLRVALLVMNQVEADAIRKSMQIIADYFKQTRQQQAQSKENTK